MQDETVRLSRFVLNHRLLAHVGLVPNRRLSPGRTKACRSPSHRAGWSAELPAHAHWSAEHHAVDDLGLAVHPHPHLHLHPVVPLVALFRSAQFRGKFLRCIYVYARL